MARERERERDNGGTAGGGGKREVRREVRKREREWRDSGNNEVKKGREKKNEDGRGNNGCRQLCCCI